MKDVLALQRGQDTSAANRIESAAALQNDWLQYAAELNRASEPADTAKRQALARMLGLFCKSTIKADEKDGNKYLAEIEIAETSDLAAVSGFKGELTFSTQGPWKLEGVKDRKVVVPKENAESLRIRTSLVGENGANTGALETNLTLQKEDVTVTIPLEDVFLPSINLWWVIGPFDHPWQDKEDLPLPPEKEIDLKATYDGKGGEKIQWKRVQNKPSAGDNPTAEYIVNFDKVFDKNSSDAAVYGLTYVEAPEDMDVVFVFKSDDGVAAWLNGTKIHLNLAARSWWGGEDRVPATLKKGRNTLLVKVLQGAGDWGMSVKIVDLKGNPLPQLRITTEPAEEEAK